MICDPENDRPDPTEDQKPRPLVTQERPHGKRGRGLIQNEADLLDTDLLPIRTAVENPPLVCEAAPIALRHRHLLCFMHRFLKSSRAEHQQEVSSVSGEVILSPRGDATAE